ncbi:hypothetical protein [Chitinophaga sp. MM2321]|uniref:hypothetical protein n=1 Tax=Chitinophaga sp. MM2321 TaxID=3137178 RepID=UPI0032D582C7
MAYFRTYSYSFTDNHNVHPANWRVDILDDQANAGSVPITLIPSSEPLILERVDTSDDKSTMIIGRQAVLSYEFTGAADEPLPELFFDADERRFKVEIYKNDSLHDNFYIKPDACEYDYKFPPYSVTLTAVDGLSFTKSVVWNAYTDSGIFDYRWMSLYEIVMERGLLQVLDSDIAMNVINTLRPDNISGDASFLNDLYVHSDMFIDFAKGPDDVYTMVEKICQQFYLRLFIAQNQVWLVRMPDLIQDVVVAENYINGALTELSLPTIQRHIGQSEASYDGVPVDFDAKVIMYPAIKEVNYSMDYRAINLVENFQWTAFDGTNFDFWIKGPGFTTLTRKGSGTIENPYRAVLPFINEPPFWRSISQGQLGAGDVPKEITVGDILQVSFKCVFNNTGNLTLIINTYREDDSQRFAIDGSGNWIDVTGVADGLPTIGTSRSGKKKNASFSLTSLPLPPIVNGRTVLPGAHKLQIVIFSPTQLNTIDPVEDGQSVEIYPIKVGIVKVSSAGRTIIDRNNARFSQVLDTRAFFFMDTGIPTLSNTIAIDDSGTPTQNWSSALNPGKVLDMEQHMADSNIDQYAKSVKGWQGNIKSNTIEFWHLFSFTGLPEINMVQMNDRYSVRNCIHQTDLQAALPEDGADTTYQEFDIEDTND